jgi:hypothetical protein
MKPRLTRLNDLLSAALAQIDQPALGESALRRLRDLISAAQAEIDASEEGS